MSKTILVVDDEMDVLDLVSQTLEPLGHDVLQAVDADIAKTILLKQEIDLLISDIKMPGKDGLALVEETRKVIKYRNLPVILFTGFHTKENVEQAVQLEVDGFLAKPFKSDQLRNLVAKLLEKGHKKRVDKSRAWEDKF
jgi:DNA-binding NtrC family response regulator